MTTPSHPGFRASLSGASLFDLVQLECTRATHGCMQVTSDGRMGYLYFDAARSSTHGTAVPSASAPCSRCCAGAAVR
jgi:hypothetical protein